MGSSRYVRRATFISFDKKPILLGKKYNTRYDVGDFQYFLNLTDKIYLTDNSNRYRISMTSKADPSKVFHQKPSKIIRNPTQNVILKITENIFFSVVPSKPTLFEVRN